MPLFAACASNVSFSFCTSVQFARSSAHSSIGKAGSRPGEVIHIHLLRIIVLSNLFQHEKFLAGYFVRKFKRAQIHTHGNKATRLFAAALLIVAATCRKFARRAHGAQRTFWFGRATIRNKCGPPRQRLRDCRRRVAGRSLDPIRPDDHRPVVTFISGRNEPGRCIERGCHWLADLSPSLARADNRR